MGISSRPFRFSFGAAERMFIFNGNKEEGEKVRFPVRCVCVCGLWNSFITYDRDRWGPLDARLGTRAVNRAWLHWSASMTTPNLGCPESKLNRLIGLLPGWLRHESNLAVNVCGTVMDVIIFQIFILILQIKDFHFSPSKLMLGKNGDSRITTHQKVILSLKKRLNMPEKNIYFHLFIYEKKIISYWMWYESYDPILMLEPMYISSIHIFLKHMNVIVNVFVSLD